MNQENREELDNILEAVHTLLGQTTVSSWTIRLTRELITSARARINEPEASNGAAPPARKIGRPRGSSRTGSLHSRLCAEIERRLKMAHGAPIKQSALKTALHEYLKIPARRQDFYAAVARLRKNGRIVSSGQRPNISLAWRGKE